MSFSKSASEKKKNAAGEGEKSEFCYYKSFGFHTDSGKSQDSDKSRDKSYALQLPLWFLYWSSKW